MQMAQCQKKKKPQPGRLERAQLNGSACPASASQAAPARSSRRPARPGRGALPWRHRRPRTEAAIRGAGGRAEALGGRHLIPDSAGPRRAAPPSYGAASGRGGPVERGRDPLGHPRHEGARQRPRPPSWTGARQGGLSQEGTRTMESDARSRAGSRTPARASGISGAGGGTRCGEGGWRRMAPEDEPYLSTASAYVGGSPDGGGNLPSLPVPGAASPPSRLPGRRRGMPEVGPAAGLPRRALRGCL